MKREIIGICIISMMLLLGIPGQTIILTIAEDTEFNNTDGSMLYFSEGKDLADLQVIKQTKNFIATELKKTVSFTIPINSISLLKTEENYDLFSIENIDTTGQAGNPTTYVTSATVILEKNVEIRGVEIYDGTYIEIKNIINLAPRKKPYIWHPKANNDNLFQKNIEIYSEDAWYPKKTVSYVHGENNENTIVHIQLYPLQYNPVKKKAILITNAEIDIYYSIKTPGNQDENTVGTSNAQNIIITTSAYKTQAEKLEKIHETYQDTPTKVITVGWIFQNYQPANETNEQGYATKKFNIINKNYDYTLARSIVSYLRDINAHPNLKSVTIFGDADIIPPSYYFYVKGGFFLVDNWIPSDLYYASPDYDLILNYEIGRIPVDTIEKADLIVQKIENWNKNFDKNWFNNVELFGGQGFGTEMLIGELSTIYPVNKGYLNGMNVQKNFLTNNQQTKSNMIACLTEGNTGIIYHIDHGATPLMAVGDEVIFYDDLMNLESSDKYPIVISVACSAAEYDGELLFNPLLSSILKKIGIKSAECLAEGVLFSKAGGVAYCGGVRTNSGSVSGTFDENGNLILGEPTYIVKMFIDIFDAYDKGHTTMGEMTNYAISEYIKSMDTGNSADFRALYEFILLGDPVLSWPKKEETKEYNPISFIPDPKPDIPEQEKYKIQLPYYNFSKIQSTTISASSNSPTINVKFYNITYKQNQNREDISFNFSHESSNSSPFFFEHQLSKDGSYLILGETEDGKETRMYFTTKPPEE